METQKITLNLDLELYLFLKHHAVDKNRTMSYFIRTAIYNWIMTERLPFDFSRRDSQKHIGYRVFGNTFIKFNKEIEKKMNRI